MKIEDYKKQKKYKVGAMKRKLGIKRGQKVEPGDMIKRMNMSKRKMAIMGMV